jgi:putative alpha-1,2-mannosidase
MSAWYVFSSLGFYPVNPISGKYDLSAPLFDKSEINLPNGKVFTVIANNISDKNIYAKSVKLNGKLLKEPFISYEDLMNGGTLVFEMTE